MQSNIEMRIEEMKSSKDQQQRNQIISDYFPFLIRVVSDEINAYVELENSEELSIAIEAFNESIDKFEKSRGHFLSFAELVVRSRVRNYLKSAYKNSNNVIYFEDLSQNESHTIEKSTLKVEENKALIDEIELFIKDISFFHLDIEDLITNKPKHKDTNLKTKKAGREISEHEMLVTDMYKKRKLPVSKVVNQLDYSLKFIKQWKKYIISIVVIYKNKYKLMVSWLERS